MGGGWRRRNRQLRGMERWKWGGVAVTHGAPFRTIRKAARFGFSVDREGVGRGKRDDRCEGLVMSKV